MQIPGETAEPLIKLLRGAGRSAGELGGCRGGQAEGGGGGGARGGGASQRRPALRDPSEREISLETHTSPQAAAGAGAKEAGRAGGKSRREGPTGGTASGRGGGGSEGGPRRLGRNSAPPPRARRGRQHGRGSRARGPRGLSFPRASLAPGDGWNGAPAQPTARAPTLAARRPRLTRGETRGPQLPVGAIPGRKPPHNASERKPLLGDPGWLCRVASAPALHLPDAFGPSAARQTIERLLCADLVGGRA